jgi:hypothetical protein
MRTSRTHQTAAADRTGAATVLLTPEPLCVMTSVVASASSSEITWLNPSSRWRLGSISGFGKARAISSPLVDWSDRNIACAAPLDAPNYGFGEQGQT